MTGDDSSHGGSQCQYCGQPAERGMADTMFDPTSCDRLRCQFKKTLTPGPAAAMTLVLLSLPFMKVWMWLRGLVGRD